MQDGNMSAEHPGDNANPKWPPNGGLAPWSRPRQGVSIRLLSPSVEYAAGEFRNPEASIVVRPDLIVAIASFREIETPEDYYSEIDFLSPFEIRLLASLLLSWDTESGMSWVYPTLTVQEKPCTGRDLSSAEVLDSLIGDFTAFLATCPGAEIHRPPCVGGRSYRFNEYSEIRRERQTEIFAAIDVTDHLLIRGLDALIKANMLGHFHEFVENACMSLWVAMEASLRMIQRELRASGTDNPTSKDAGRFLDDAFNWESDGYFVSYYDARIKTIHPESRFGIYPGASLQQDDFYDLYSTLILVYDFLLTDHVPEEPEEQLPDGIG
jgi:hypothetical protein